MPQTDGISPAEHKADTSKSAVSLHLPGAWQAADGYWYADRHRQDADGNWHTDDVDPPGYHHGGMGPCPRTYDEMVYHLAMERWGHVRDAYKAANPEWFPAPPSDNPLFLTGEDLRIVAEIDETLITCGELPPMPDEPPEWEDAEVRLIAYRRNDDWNCYEPLATAADRRQRHQAVNAPAKEKTDPKADHLKTVNPMGWRIAAPQVEGDLS